MSMDGLHQNRATMDFDRPRPDGSRTSVVFSKASHLSTKRASGKFWPRAAGAISVLPDSGFGPINQKCFLGKKTSSAISGGSFLPADTGLRRSDGNRALGGFLSDDVLI